MENEYSNSSVPDSLAVRGAGLDDGINLGVDLLDAVGQRVDALQPFRNLLEHVLDCRQPARYVVVGPCHGLAELRDMTALQDRAQMLRVPVEGDGQRFQRAGAAAALRLIAAD